RQAGLGRRARLLEIAPGTGQATLLLAKMGYRITGVELRANMARIARERLKAYPNVEIVTASFEAAELPAAAFDLVYVATALHWIATEARFSKIAGTAQGLGPSRHHSSALCFGRARRCVHHRPAAHLSALRTRRGRGRQDLSAATDWAIGAGAHRRGAVYTSVVRHVPASRDLLCGGLRQ